MNAITHSLPHINTVSTQERRGRFGELITLADGTAASEVVAKFKAALPEEFVSFDKHGRGDALNHDLYGYDAAQNVAIIQIRHAFRRYRNGHLNLHKTYVLCGFNELTELPFRHPISAHGIRAAVNKGADAKEVVLAGQRWMWQVTPRQLEFGIRQGDVLLVPESRGPRASLKDLGREHVVGGSHVVKALRIVRDSRAMVWAEGPSLYHSKGQHHAVYADHDGWHTVRMAREAPSWDFASRVGD